MKQSNISDEVRKKKASKARQDAESLAYQAERKVKVRAALDEYARHRQMSCGGWSPLQHYVNSRQILGTQDQVAKWLGISRVTLARRETGVFPLTLEMIYAMDALHQVERDTY